MARKFTLYNPFTILGEIYRREGTIMAKLDDVQAALDAIPPVLDAIAADEAKQATEIQALKDIIAAGGTITEAQLDPLLARANEIKARVDAIDVGVA